MSEADPASVFALFVTLFIAFLTLIVAVQARNFQARIERTKLTERVDRFSRSYLTRLIAHRHGDPDARDPGPVASGYSPEAMSIRREATRLGENNARRLVDWALGELEAEWMMRNSKSRKVVPLMGEIAEICTAWAIDPKVLDRAIAALNTDRRKR